MILRKKGDSARNFRFSGAFKPQRRNTAGGRLMSLISIDESLANRRILLAEDEGLIALDVEAMLQTFGCEVVGPLSELEDRSEEHTSELQSRRDLVCRLLLEKKKKKK